MINYFNQIKLSEEYSFYYKTWLASFITIVLANAVVHNLIIDKFYEIDLIKIVRTIKDPAVPALELNVISYAILTAVMVFFISKALPKRHIVPVGTLYGMMFGLAVFLLHTFTNYAMLRNWSIAIVIIEICWGLLQGGLIGYIIAFMYKDHKKRGLFGIFKG